MNIAKVFYRSVGLFSSLILGPIFLLHKRGRQRLIERYGHWQLEGEDLIWLHGASLGETKGIVPVLARLRKFWPDSKFLVTAQSPSGLPPVESLADYVRLLPFDHPLWIGRALSNIKPRCLIISETELWPSLLEYASEKDIPIYLINALVSDYTFSKYKLLRGLLKGSLGQVRLVLAASSKDKDRFEYLGAPAAKTFVVGNSKYDQLPSLLDPWQREEVRDLFFPGADGPVLVLGSLRPGEERIWFAAIAKCIATQQQFRVIVAPRHKEKFDYFAKRLRSYHIPFQLWSKIKVERRSGAIERSNVILLDTLGELERVYSFATAAFIGGTIVNWGGHNPLEAAAYGVALIAGRYTQKIHEVVESLKVQDALKIVNSVAEAKRVILDLATDPKSFRASGESAQKVWQVNIGAAQRIVEHIKKDYQLYCEP